MSGVLDFVASAVLLLVPQPCFDEFFVKFNFFDVDCLKIAISKCLGFGIILGSVLVKIPQIVKIMAAKSAEGINILSVTLELVAVTGSLVYAYANKYPFSAYGESMFLVLQTLVIAFLVLMYQGKTAASIGYTAVYAVTLGFLMSPMASMSLLWGLQASVMPIIAMAKMIQAMENFKNSSTGQLSAITVFLLFLGSIARIFTSIQETGDNIIILTYVVSTLCNGIIAAQMVFYWGAKPHEKKE